MKISHRNSRVDCELVCTPCTWRSNTAKDMKRTSLYWTTDVSSWAHDMSIKFMDFVKSGQCLHHLFLPSQHTLKFTLHS